MAKATKKTKVTDSPKEESITFHLGEAVRLHNILGDFVITFCNTDQKTVNLLSQNGTVFVQNVAIGMLKKI